MTTHLMLIRHGHVDTGPPPGRLCGWLDLPLSSRGRSALDAMREQAPRHEVPGALYTSSLTRARDVADALAVTWGLVAQVDGTLREIHCGEFEGRPIADIRRSHVWLWARNTAQTDEAFAWPGGESYRAFRNRVLMGLSRIAAAHPGQRVAVVTHTGVITQVLGAIRGRSPAIWDADRPDPLTATHVRWVNGAPASLLGFNEREWY